MIAGAVTLILYYFTELMNWNVFGWLSWILIGIGGWMMSSEDKEDEKEKPDKAMAQVSKEENNNIKLLRNLYAIGAADKKMRGEEQAFILVVMKQSGMDVNEIVKQMNRCSEHGCQIVAPSSDEQIAIHLTMMAKLMMIDGKAAESEKKLLKNVAGKWGCNPDSVDDIIESLENDDDYQELKTQLKGMAQKYGFDTVDA